MDDCDVSEKTSTILKTYITEEVQRCSAHPTQLHQLPMEMAPRVSMEIKKRRRKENPATFVEGERLHLNDVF